MDILCCFRKSKRNTSPTISHDSKRTRPSIFRIFRKKKYSRVCENDLDNTNREESITVEPSSDETLSAEQAKTQNREMPPETIEVQNNPALYKETVQDKVTKSLKTSVVKNVRPNVLKRKGADRIPKPRLFDTNNVKQIRAQMQPDLNIIDFSNINPKSLTSRFINNLELCIEYQWCEKYLYDVTNIQFTLENYRNITRFMKLEDEYVTVEITSRLGFDTSEPSSNESMCLNENIKPSIPNLNSIPTAGINAKKKKRKRKKKKMGDAPCFPKTIPSCVFTGISYSQECQDKFKTVGAHLKPSLYGQPTPNNFLSTKTGQPIFKNTLPTTSGQPIVKVPVPLTGKTAADTLLSSLNRLEGFPYIYQQNKTLPSVAIPLTSKGAQPRAITPQTTQPVGRIPKVSSQKSISSQIQVGQPTTKPGPPAASIPGTTRTGQLVVNQTDFPSISQPKKNTQPSVTNPQTSKGALPRYITPQSTQPVGRIPTAMSQNFIIPLSQVEKAKTKSGQPTAKVAGATAAVQLGINQKKKPVEAFPIPAPAKPSTSSTKNLAVSSKPRFECISLEKVHEGGFLINRSVEVSVRNWNCVTGVRNEMLCEFCKSKITRNTLNSHIKTSAHQKNLQDCPILGVYGQALIRKMKSDLFHCAICNATFTKAYTAKHVNSKPHASMYKAAVQRAIAIMGNNTSLQKLEKFTVTHDDENFTNAANKTASRAQESEKSNAISSVTSELKKKGISSSQQTADKSKYLDITSLQKVHGEGFIINKTVLISVRSYNALSGPNAARFCNVCQKDAEGINGFMHLFQKEHTDNMKKYQYLKDYGLNLFRKMPNYTFYCSICAEVICDANAHNVSLKHCEQYIKSYMKTDQILSNPSKYKIVSL